MTTPDLRKSIPRSPLRLGLFLIPLVLAWLAISPAARAVDPPPDGGYPGENTAEGDDALFSLTTRMGNTVPADTIYWTSWSTNTAGSIATPKTAISVTYSGELDGLSLNYPSWNPSTTYADGVVVANAPPQSGNTIRLYGGGPGVNTITFSAPAVNPVFSIWSLGEVGIPAKFRFTNATPTFVVGGPSTEFGGGSINVSGNTVSGSEANGTVTFLGTYSSISWNNPSFEFWYGFTVGVASAETSIAIDIKPDTFPNSINPRSKGVIPVAILTTDTFDATAVDPTTVRFGANGTEAAPVQSALEDVDGDGDTDMILHFKTQDTGIVCGDTSASLTGETFGGEAIEGSDSIQTVGCK